MGVRRENTGYCRSIAEIKKEMETRGIWMTTDAVKQALKRAERKIRAAKTLQMGIEYTLHQ